MQVAILSARTGWHTSELCRALAERGHSGVVLPYEQLRARLGGATAGAVAQSPAGAVAPTSALLPSSRSPGQARAVLESAGLPLFAADAVLARIIPAGSLEQIIYRVDALHWLEERGVPVMNSPRAIERSVDKFYTDALLTEAGIPTPPTVVCESVDDAVDAVRHMGSAVIKPIFGSMGHGLVRVSDPDTAWRVLRALAQVGSVFYVQQAIEHDGRDVRAFVCGGRVLGAIERIAAPGDWRSNVSRGAMARPTVLPEAWSALAVRAAAIVGADYAGVDLLPQASWTNPTGAGDQPFVLEVNGIPGWEGLQTATGVDVAGGIVEHLLTKIRSGRSSSTELMQ
jgi:RimK family alpha-L-glutamate ligase